MGAFIKYWCSANCGKTGKYNGSLFTFNFKQWAEAHSEHVAQYGRHGPDQIPCPACGSPAFKKGGETWRAMERSAACTGLFGKQSDC
jgi:hypothetical protein